MRVNGVSISRKLNLLVLIAILPALAVLVYAGLEQRQQARQDAQRKVQMLAHVMAEIQNGITTKTEQTLHMLALFPQVQQQDLEACTHLFRQTVSWNPEFFGLTLVDLKGNVIASNRPFSGVNLADRKHVHEAITQKKFAAGEYILTRVGKRVPVFSYASPVLDEEGKLQSILTAVLKLNVFEQLFNQSNLPEKSFVSVTDHKGIRLLYFPQQNTTNPIGKPIRQNSFLHAQQADKSGVLVTHGSDGTRRIFAFEQVRLHGRGPAYLYLWAGVPESSILRPANMGLMRNGFLMFAVAGFALLIARLIAQNTFVVPLASLVRTTKSFSQGAYEKRSDLAAKADEIGVLATAFNRMADALVEKEKSLHEKILALEAALEEIQTLRGILPICSYCKNIRNDEGYYEQIEQYIQKHSGVAFSHTICPACMETHHPKEYAAIQKRKTGQAAINEKDSLDVPAKGGNV